MIIDESRVQSAHLALIKNGNLGDAFLSGIRGNCDLIYEIVTSTILHQSVAADVVIGLGTRVYNDATSAGRNIACGYWTSAIHSLRDIVESHQLVELFHRYPDRAADWLTCEKRHIDYGFTKIANELQKVRGDNPGMRQSHRDWSNFGSHPSADGLDLHIADRNLIIGPTYEPNRFRWLTADLWQHTSRFADEFMKGYETLIAPEPKLEDVHTHLVRVHRGANFFLRDLKATDITAYWK